MAITILEYVKSVIGDKDFYTVEDFSRSGIAIVIRGCERCSVILAAHDAYLSVSQWRCADCIGDDGFATVADFTASFFAVACPVCGNTDTISETRATTGEHAEGYVLECGDCGESWQL